MFNLNVGMTATIDKIIDEGDTHLATKAGHFHSLLSTPALSSLIISAAAHLADEKLPEGYVTVGTKLNLKHLAPTPIGHRVTVTVTLKEVQNKRLVFFAEARDEKELIGIAWHIRMVTRVDRVVSEGWEKLR
jgi:predicted thioesterase